MLENVDKIMHLRFNFDACPMHSPSGFLHLTYQNLSARALFCLNSLAKVNTQLLIYNYCTTILYFVNPSYLISLHMKWYSHLKSYFFQLYGFIALSHINKFIISIEFKSKFKINTHNYITYNLSVKYVALLLLPSYYGA